jgi:signal transduction histidine kinase
VDLPDRYPEQIEAAVYFCCLEAIQNAAKYAGQEASIEVRVAVTGGVLEFQVSDNGPGFEIGSNGLGGAGFVNMTDRLGAIGGTLHVDSRPGAGTVVRGEIPMGCP